MKKSSQSEGTSASESDSRPRGKKSTWAAQPFTSEAEESTGNSRQTSGCDSPSKKRSAGKRAPEPEPEGEQPPDEEIEAALDLLLQGVPPEEFDAVMLRCCVEELNLLKKESIANKNYLEAGQYSELAKRASKAAGAGNFNAVAAAKLSEYLEKQASAQEKVDEVNTYWDRMFREFEEMVDSRMQQMAEQQNDELEDFDLSAPEDLPPRYQKHSAEYTALRRREEMLLKNEDYEKADQVRQKADTLEQAELTDQHAKLQGDLSRERNAMIDKHTRQYEAFATWLNSRRNQMVVERDKQLRGPMNRLNHYTKLIERIERKGLAPNPSLGYASKNVSRKETIKAVRAAAQAQVHRDKSRSTSTDMSPIPQFRPPIARVMSSSGTKTPKTKAGTGTSSGMQSSYRSSSKTGKSPKNP